MLSDHLYYRSLSGNTPVFWSFPCGSAGKESSCNAGDLDLIPGLGRSPGEGKDYPLQYSHLENSMDCTVHGVTKSQTRLSDFHFLYSLVRKFSLIRLKLLSGCVSPVCCFFFLTNLREWLLLLVSCFSRVQLYETP